MPDTRRRSTRSATASGAHAPPGASGARLVDGEVAAAAAVEELIRWDPPLQLFERWVLEDGVEVARRADPARRGARAALRRPRTATRECSTEPDRFDVGRGNADRHIGFGGGIHVCIGAPLARIELEVALRTLVSRCPGLELVAEPARNDAFVIWGLEKVALAVA